MPSYVLTMIERCIESAGERGMVAEKETARTALDSTKA